MRRKKEVQQGTLALMVLKTLDVLGPQHGYGLAKRIEQISADALSVNQGTLYPLLLKLEQEGAITSEWGPSDNNRRARFYRLTADWTPAAPGRNAQLGADDGADRPLLRRQGGGPAVKALRRFLSRLLTSDHEAAGRGAIEGGARGPSPDAGGGERPRRYAAGRGATPGGPQVRTDRSDQRQLPRRAEACRVLDDFLQDVRYTFRQLRKAPLFTLTAIDLARHGHRRQRRGVHGRRASAASAAARLESARARLRDGRTDPDPVQPAVLISVLRGLAATNRVLNGVAARSALGLNVDGERTDA